MPSHTRWYLSAVCLIVLLAQPDSATAQKEPFKGLDDYVVKSMKEWETPGLALAIVRNDSVIYMKGYGVRKMGEAAPVSAKTVFAIASTTKAMTAACLGILVDEGKMKWDDPVTKYLPGFQLYDPYVSRELTVRDLLCHRSGLARGDNLWYLSPYSRDEVLQRVRFLKPLWGFRSRYGYQNIMFIAAGQMIPSATSKSWDEFIAERLFQPLGMKRSTTSVTAVKGMEDVATPHARINDVMQPIRWPNFDNVGPAGSVNSCVEDMAQWIRMNLNGGMFKGKKILSTDVVKEMHTPQTVIRIDSLNQVLWPSNHFAAYGFGWSLRDYLGRKLVQHDGALNGMRARVVLIPEEKTGLVILFNSSNTNLHASIAYRIIDHYLGGVARDWSAELRRIAKEQEEKNKAEEKKKEEERVKGSKPALSLDGYIGKYTNEMYGDCTVNLENGKLVLKFYPGFEGPMEHWHYDTFKVVWNDPELDKEMVSFVLGSDGKVSELRWEGFTEFTRSK